MIDNYMGDNIDNKHPSLDNKHPWVILTYNRPAPGFMDINGFINLIKSKTCFKDQGCCTDLILTNRKCFLKNSSSYETSISDHHHHHHIIT